MSRNTARRKVVASLATVALAATVAMVTGSVSASAATKKLTPQTGGTLTFLTHSPRLDHLDPTRIYTGRDLAFETAYFVRTLVSFKHVAGPTSTSLVPDLATNTGVPSNSAKQWRFTLRPGSKFQDGKDITCADVKYGVSRVFDQTVLGDGPTYMINWLDIPVDKSGSSIYQGPFSSSAAGIAAFDKAVICSADNRTITFKLGMSVGDFNYLLTYPVVSPVQKAHDLGDKYDLSPEATGPYMIKENTSAHLMLVRNPNWNKSSDPIRTPYPDQILLNYGLDQQVQDQIILSDSVPNAMSFDAPLPTNLKAFFESSSFKGGKLNEDTAFVGYIAFNVKKMPCLQIRAAMYYARNAKALLDYAGGPTYNGSYVTSLTSPLNTIDYAANGVWGPPNADWKPEGNVAKAQALMDEAKTACPAEYKRVTTTGVTIDVRQSSTLTDTIPINKAAFARVGIVVNYNPISAGYYPTVMNASKQNDLSNSGWSQDWPNASTVIPPLYTPEGGFDLSQNTGEAIYAAFHAGVMKAIGTSNRAAQAAQWKALDKQAAAQFWVLPTLGIKTQVVWGTGVQGAYYWLPQGEPDYAKLWVTK